MRFKTVLLPALLLLPLFALGCNDKSETAPKPKIGVVDSSRVFQESKAGKAGVKYLDNLGNELQAQLLALQETAEKSGTDEARQALQKGFNDLQQRFGAEQQQVMNKVTESYQKAVDTLRTQEGLDVIIGTESAVSYDPKSDITQKVIALMDATPVSFDAIQPENGAGKAPSANGTQPSTNGTQPSTNSTQKP